MGLDSTSQVAAIIGGLSREQGSIKESFADQGDSSFLLSPFESVKVSGEVVVTKNVYASDSLVWNHPVNGDLNVFVWNGGYDSSQSEVLFDKSF